MSARRNADHEVDRVRLTVNGRPIEVAHAGGSTLGSWLRSELGLTGTKLACEEGFCGACSVLVDDQLVSSCSVLLGALDNAEVLTIEGLRRGSALHPVQQAFIDNRGFQCGYCTAGMVMTTVALLSELPAPSDEEIRRYFEGNLCRCTGYTSILESVKDAAAALLAQSTADE